MQNKWEEYFKEHDSEKDLFNADEERMWRSINQELKQPKLSFKKIGLRVAVVMAIVFSVSVVIRHELMMQQQLDSLAALSEELAETEHNYINQVKLKWDEYKSLPSRDIELDKLLLDELEILDTIYDKGLNDIKDHGYNERAVVIMLDTYEKRLRIIERLINEKRKQERDENKSNHIRI